MQSLVRISKGFSRYLISINNLGLVNTIKIIITRLFPGYKIQKINTKKFGSIYWRPKFDFGVMTHFFTPQIDFDTKNDKPNIIFDIGANIGIETFRFRKLFPFSKIISIEANKENFNILKKNLDQDKNVVTLNLGIWNEKTKLKLKKSNKNSSQSFSYEKLDSNEKGEEFIDADTIQGVIDKFSISEIDILKIDVEGAENFIFDNSCDFWISKVKTIIAECPDSDAPFTTIKIFESFKRNNLFFNTYINGENLVFIRKDCFWRSKPIMFY